MTSTADLWDTLFAAQAALRERVGVCLAKEVDCLRVHNADSARYWCEQGRFAADVLLPLSRMLER